MASAKFEKGSSEFQWFGQFWQIVQKHWIPEADDFYWDSLTSDVNELYEKFKDNEKLERFTKAMAIRFMDFMVEENKNVR